jgi:hypothetical protein
MITETEPNWMHLQRINIKLADGRLKFHQVPAHRPRILPGKIILRNRLPHWWEILFRYHSRIWTMQQNSPSRLHSWPSSKRIFFIPASNSIVDIEIRAATWISRGVFDVFRINVNSIRVIVFGNWIDINRGEFKTNITSIAHSERIQITSESILGRASWLAEKQASKLWRPVARRSNAVWAARDHALFRQPELGHQWNRDSADERLRTRCLGA